jgi:hypothetical protein
LKVTAEVVPVGAAGLKTAVTPAGSPLAERVTAPANPPVRAIVTVVCAVAPCAADPEVGLTERVKSGVGSGIEVFTVRASDAVFGSTPVPVPRTVNWATPTAAPAAAVS